MATPAGIGMGLRGLAGNKGLSSINTRGRKVGPKKQGTVANFGEAMGQVAMAAARTKQRNMSAANRAAYGVPEQRQVKAGSRTLAKIISRGKRKGVVTLGGG